MAYVGLHAADGSLNLTVVSGSVYTGLFAADGSLNVILAPGGVYVGSHHPCGALYVTLVTSGVVGYYAADGSMNVIQSPYTPTGGTKVTVVTGSLSPGGTGYLPYGLLTTYFG